MNGNKTGNGFENNPQNINREGRPKRGFSAIIAQAKREQVEFATPENVKNAIELLLALPLSEVIAIAGSPSDKKNEYPAIMRVAAKEMLGKNGWAVISDMLKRAHGNPEQKQEFVGADGAPLFHQVAVTVIGPGLPTSEDEL